MDIKEVMQKAVRALLSSGSYDDLNEEQNAVVVEFETEYGNQKLMNCGSQCRQKK